MTKKPERYHLLPFFTQSIQNRNHNNNEARYTKLNYNAMRSQPRQRRRSNHSVMKQWFVSSRIVRCFGILFISIMMGRFILYPSMDPKKPTVAEIVASPIETLHPQQLQLPIPHRILFTYKTNILETKEPKLYYDNILNTIHQYKTMWNNEQQQKETTTPIEYFLDNAACRQQIQMAAPELVPYFDTESKGMFKGDMCRTAALYNQGGYYFDVDIQVIHPIALEQNTSFSSVVSSTGVFFQAFLAASPQHPILQRTLQEMLYYYQNKPKLQWFLGLPMGCETLTKAYRSLAPSQRGNVRILQEMNLARKHDTYPELPRQVGKGHLCNYIVHDETEKQPYFFSRLVGSFRCPYENTTSSQFVWQWLGND